MQEEQVILGIKNLNDVKEYNAFIRKGVLIYGDVALRLNELPRNYYIKKSGIPVTEEQSKFIALNKGGHKNLKLSPNPNPGKQLLIKVPENIVDTEEIIPDFCDNIIPDYNPKAKPPKLKKRGLAAITVARDAVIAASKPLPYIKSKLSRSEQMKKAWAEGRNTGMNGRHLTEAQRYKISAANQIRKIGEGNNRYKAVWLYNDALKKNKSVLPDQLEGYLKDGWVKGRKVKYYSNRKQYASH
jgi:hypothetical protein